MEEKLQKEAAKEKMIDVQEQSAEEEFSKDDVKEIDGKMEKDENMEEEEDVKVKNKKEKGVKGGIKVITRDEKKIGIKEDEDEDDDWVKISTGDEQDILEDSVTRAGKEENIGTVVSVDADNVDRLPSKEEKTEPKR
ncbi:chromo domain-containing protein cec-1-like isoform X1 [Ptychodera flava]|uniref:chromo domain-containing protein cec-1-like isoform X1 n=1 Tax=Ptychodera flava TaxID=63121 RepID=UPI00396A4608